jgi:chromate transport protein ChrA
MEKQKIYKPRYLLKEIICGVVGFVMLVLPIAVVIIINREAYFHTETKESLSIGLIMALIVAVLQLCQLTKKWNGIIWLAVFALVLHFLRPILGDLELLLWMACLGQVMYLPFKYLKERYNRLRKAYEEGKINSETNRENFESIVEAITGIGR